MRQVPKKQLKIKDFTFRKMRYFHITSVKNAISIYKNRQIRPYAPICMGRIHSNGVYLFGLPKDMNNNERTSFLNVLAGSLCYSRYFVVLSVDTSNLQLEKDPSYNAKEIDEVGIKISFTNSIIPITRIKLYGVYKVKLGILAHFFPPLLILLLKQSYHKGKGDIDMFYQTFSKKTDITNIGELQRLAITKNVAEVRDKTN